MRTPLLLAALAVCASTAAAANPLALSINSDGSYALSSPSWPALSLSSGPVGLQSAGAWLSTADGSLVLSGPRVDGSGVDAWGGFNTSAFTYAAASAPATALLVTAFKTYFDVPAVDFKATFPAGLTSGETSTKNKDATLTAFPSWTLPATSPLGFVQWAGPFINNGNGGPVFGKFTAAGGAKTGLSAGPLALLDDTAAASLVLSSSSEHMAVSNDVRNGSLVFGPLGSAFSLPVGYSYSCVAFLGNGVNTAIQGWGAALLKRSGKPHGLSMADFTNTHLIYNLDHGAYFYYNVGEYANYCERHSPFFTLAPCPPTPQPLPALTRTPSPHTPSRSCGLECSVRLLSQRGNPLPRSSFRFLVVF